MSNCPELPNLAHYAYLDDLDHLDPHRDDACQTLVDYLGYGLNYAIARKLPDQIAVRSTRSYDAVDFDTTSFPMLKVFRQKESVDLSQTSKVDLVCTYAMLMPDRDQLPGIMHWIAKHIVAMLISQRESSLYCPFRILEGSNSLSVEYRIMVDNLNQPAYAYLRVIFSAIENN